MQLNEFIQAYVSSSARLERDFTGPRGWMHLTNLVLKRYERYGWFKLDRMKEVGVEVSNDYWITIPTDLREVVEIYAPPLNDYTQMERLYRCDIVNGKIKLKTPFDKKSDPDTYTLSSWLANGVSINNAVAEESAFKDHILVVTDGSLSGKNITIADNEATSGGLVTLSFYHNDGAVGATSTTGYLTDEYLMLKYMASFTGLTAYTDEIPIDDRFEDVLAQSLIVESTSKKDKDFKTVYQLERDMIEDVNNELFSPDAGMRIRPRKLAGYDTCIPDDDFEYIGDGEDE